MTNETHIALPNGLLTRLLLLTFLMVVGSPVRAIADEDVPESFSTVPHLFKTMDVANLSYYLIQPTDDSDSNADRQYLTTSNVPSPRMQWLVEPATKDGDVQYYYIVNGETGKYIYFTGTGLNQGKSFCVKSHDEAGAEEDRFMFRFWKKEGYYNISPKKFSEYTPEQNKGNMLCKQNATDHYNPIGLYQDNNTAGRARWQLLDVPASPKTLSALPEDTVSTSTSYVYLKLRNAVQSSGTDYYVYPPSTTNYATAATSGDNPEWYLQQADDADTWNTYYYLRNAQTGRYLYFSGTSYVNNDNSFFESSNISAGSEDMYKFLVLKTANTTYSRTYHIVPKTIRNNNNQANIALNRDNNKLRTLQSRATNASCWYLDRASDFKCAKPRVSLNLSGKSISITCDTKDVDIYYSFSGDLEATEAYRYTAPITTPTGSYTLKTFAQRNASGSDRSDISTFEKKTITSGDEIESMDGYYYLAENFTPPTDPIGTAADPFRGTIDGQLNAFELSCPLFDYVEGATIKNVIISNAKNISESGDVGAIANNAKGDTRIYNCGILSGSVSGTGYVGGLVGLLDGSSRVINCYSYADVAGGTDVGGIVGYNNVATTAGNLKTMVMNCMFYGDITGGTTVSPVYGGQNINNLNTGSQNQSTMGLNTFNYYAYDKLKTKTINKYNCALAVEEKYLTRFEFYRQLLNSNSRLAAYYAFTETTPVSPVDMAKWVLETADRTIADPKPYPVLKSRGKYPSIINYDVANAPDSATVRRNHGGKLGRTLTVTIDGVGSGAPAGATLTTSSLSLQRTDKDFDRFNFNYDKVQLPYYNDVGTGNYTKNKVVTGWKITSITAIAGDPYSSSNYPTTGIMDYPDHNYADRKSSNKDLYSVSGRVFSQGAYFDVPYGVTAITIEPYWGEAAYVADEYFDKVYNAGYGVENVQLLGRPFGTNNVKVSINGDLQSVCNSIGEALKALSTGGSVYDHAVVLVGNLHQGGVPSNGDKLFTLMSIDLDSDNEPDCSLIYNDNARSAVCPLRFDFLNVIGTAQAQKPSTATDIRNAAVFKTKGWFEITNTALMYFSQFEYENQEGVTKGDAPLILQGGVFNQFVSTQKNDVSGHTIYIHVGGNCWFHEFNMGTHSDGNKSTPHVPVSVTGGDYDTFYLTGTYNPNADVKDDNAECYISGGRFGELAGAAQEQIGSTNYGNVRWQIYDADITEFYGGGVNDAKPVQGNITTDIYNSHVGIFCGGPKFGNMAPGKSVTTTAVGCVFDKYFGAGNGGNSYSRKKYFDQTSFNWGTLNGYYTSDKGKYYDGKTTAVSSYGYKGPGVATDYDYEFFVWTSGKPGVRYYVKFASFSLAQCNDVSSSLKNCTIKGSFYGGGNLGSVVGTATSVLDGCTVNGSVFGGGYSASLPPIPVRSGVFTKNPNFNSATGMFEPGVYPVTTDYEWKKTALLDNGDVGTETADGKNYVKTNVDLTALGKVAHTDLTIKGNTKVLGQVFDTDDNGTIRIDGEGNYIVKETTGGVFGGGDMSAVNGNTKVDIQDTDETGILNVFGGGNTADVDGNTEVSMTGGTVSQDVYGGGRGATTKVAKATVHFGKENEGSYEGTATIRGNIYGGSALGTVNEAEVNLYKGTMDASTDDGTTGNVFGGGRGAYDEYNPTNDNAVVSTKATVNLYAVTVPYGIYGGCNTHGTVTDTEVNLYGGTIGKAFDAAPTTWPDVLFGGGLGAQTSVTGTTKVELKTTADLAAMKVYGNVYGGSKNGSVAAVDVNLLGGTIWGNVFGGGYQTATDKTAATSVNVTLNGTKFDRTYEGSAQIFGANNLQGTPTGHVKVHVMRTVGSPKPTVDDTEAHNPIGLADRTTYDVEAVYGGGNQADYIPTNATLDPDAAEGNQALIDAAYAEVLIEGCDQTSIKYVYGGGNAAAVPATEVTINSAYIIDQLFGGGNGAGEGNPGANVGIYNNNGTPTNYGTGIAKTKLVGGQVHYVYGGSNTKGNVRGGTSLERKDSNDCSLVIGELYGAGQIAPMDGNVDIQLDCMPEEFVEAVYGGAKNATINGNVSLTVRSGKFGRVFGGNNLGGSINGSITVNAYEGGCEPLIIGELYGGGYNAPYSIYGCNDDDDDGDWTPNAEEGEPHVVQDAEHPAVGVYVRSCTSIGKVFGGGYGATADVVGNTRVWINLQKGFVNDVEQPNIGKIGQVFGGGNMGKVKGNVSIEIGTETSSDDIGVNIIDGDDYLKPDGSSISIEAGIYGGGNEADVDGDVTLHIGTENQKVDDEPSITIEGDIFGGGYGASTHVTGSVAINIGKRTETTSESGTAVSYIGNATITGDVYGGSALGSVNSGDNTSATDDATTSVTLNTGTITGSIYGGGYGQQKSGTEGEEGYVEPFEANVYGPVTVTVYNGAVSESVYGCNNKNGSPKNNVDVNIVGGTITTNVYGGGNEAAYNGEEVLTVEMSGGSATDVFGGGLGTSATVTGSTVVNVTGGTVSDNIYGGGSEADLIGSADVTVSGGSAKTVYGGGNVANVSGSTTVSITGGTLSGSEFDDVTGAVFGGGYGETTRVGGSVTVNIGSTTNTTVHNDETNADETSTTYGGSANITGDVYGGSAKGRVNTTDGADVSADNPTTHVNLYGGTISGSLYGGGLGEDNEGTESDHAAHVYGAVVVTMAGGQVSNVFGCNNILGAPQHTVAVNINGGTVTNSVYGGGNQAAYLYADASNPLQVKISGGTMDNVFGGGLSAEVAGGINVTVNGGTVTNDVYGGGALANTNTANWNASGSAVEYVDITSTLTVGTTSIAGYYTKSDDDYTLMTYGTATEETTYYKKAVVGSWAEGMNNETTGSVYKTNVVLTGGTIGNAYGGGLGNETTAANVYGDVTVTVNKPVDLTSTGGTGIGFSHRTERVTYGEGDHRKEYIIPVTGRVFGCNNINGTPTGNVRVSVYQTRQADENGKVISQTEHSPNSSNDRYEIQGVYGGGNLSDYLPADGKDTRVYVGECNVTSIEKVYGGGNSASVPSSDVTINGSYDIGYAFGGGNGGDLVKRGDTWYENDGAIVIGLANIKPIGGKIGQVFGGSDAKGVCGRVNIDKSETNSGCPLKLTRLYGAGNEADVNEVNIVISGCSGDTDSEIKYVWGGSYNAHVAGDVNLTITAGIFNSIYGGNDRTGSIGGNITVNIEETDNCMPIKIQNLLGGGYQAAYPGTRRDGKEITTPGKITVNVKSATRIDNIYGGSYMADVNGDTEVNINMTKGYFAGRAYAGESITDAVGTIGNVYGGGNLGLVRGNSTVNIGTATTVGFVTEPINLRTESNTELPKTSDLYYVPVLGANITGDVFGGGNEGNVNGDAVVNICTADYSGTAGFEGVSIGGSVYGGGSKADVKTNTTVTMAGGYVFDGVYGGGLQGSVGTFTRTPLPADHPTHDGCLGGKPDVFTDGTGKCTVVVSGGQVGPVEVALTEGGMKNTRGYYLEAGETGPVDYGFVFGAGRGEVEDPATDPDADFRVYVKETEVIVKNTYATGYENGATDSLNHIVSSPLIMASVYGGGENGRVRGNTLVKIYGGQIGCGESKTAPYTEEQWTVEDPSVFTECAHWEYEAPYLPHDPLADVPYSPNNPVTDGSTTATDGHTYYGSVFGGGSGYYPYEIKDASGNVIGHDWLRSAGVVEGSTKVLISGGHILTSVYGGNEYTDVTGDSCVVIMTGGTLGVPRTDDDMQKHPVTCYLFGAGKGDQRTHFNTWTNVQNTRVYVGGTARIFGSVFGGGEDGHVLENAKVQICGGTIGTTGTSYVDGNVFGGGRGYSGVALTAGSIGGNVEVKITGGTMLGSVYGGGRLASVGIDFTPSTDPSYGQLVDETGTTGAPTYGHVTVNITGGTIGNEDLTGNEEGAEHSGNVFGGSMGRNTLLDGSINELWPKLGVVKVTDVTIDGTADIKRSVYGGSEFSIVRNRATVNIKGGTVGGSVFGGGYGSDDHATRTVITAGGYDDIPSVYYTFTPMVWNGCVSGNTFVNISGGQVKKNVYGGGYLASVGLINFNSDAEGNFNYVTKHEDLTNSFALSWPYEFQYIAAAPNDAASVDGGEKAIGGKATINITGGRIGDSSDAASGYVFGGSKGKVMERYAEAACANVKETEVTINYDGPTPTIANAAEAETYFASVSNLGIQGAVYGGGEDGHVYQDASVEIKGGLIGMSVYGGGKGINTYKAKLKDLGTKSWKAAEEDVPSWTAGKVYGNTTVTMSGGHITRNIFGGGYYASVGKGNYSGGVDDYYKDGYGETLAGNLWDGSNTNSTAFLNSGKTTVTVTAGSVGTPDGTYDGNATGMIYGGSRGAASRDIDSELIATRYEYTPDFYLGYANETYVTIGDETHAPTIYGSVYGGGRDGVVRRSAKVTINKGTIGLPYSSDDAYSHDRGNVYGAGSGMSTWDDTHHGTSSGTVVGKTTVVINDGIIHQNVYGGGAMASVGPLKNGEDYASKDLSLCTVTINGGNIGTRSEHTTNGYGGNVFGSSRGGDFATGESTDSLATTIWTQVNINGGTINGDVYGGGEAGCVKKSTEVNLTGGTIADDAYGGGKGTTTIAADVGGDATVELNNNNNDADADGSKPGCVVSRIFGCNDLNGSPKGHVKVHVYGTQHRDKSKINEKYDKFDKLSDYTATNYSGLTTLATAVGADVSAYTTVLENAGATDAAKTAALESMIEAISDKKYDVQAVYGGGNLAMYYPTDADSETESIMNAARTEVIINGCELTSIKHVYGGSNAASTPATYVRVNGTHEIHELFGGGNGNDAYQQSDGKWYENPGANVGYKNYTHYVTTGGTAATDGDGTLANPYKAHDNDNAGDKDSRQAYYHYGSGVATTEAVGGRIHNVYGGSNKKGNISKMALSAYQESGTCTLAFDKTYGAGKDAEIDGEVSVTLDCVDNVDKIFGGATNADVNSDVVLNITNGNFNQVFGGNDTGGKLIGSITVNIQERGCKPINIGELYGGGYLAGYSIYGYNSDNTPRTKKQFETARTAALQGIDTEDETAVKNALLANGLYGYPKHDPHVNVISATSIGSVYGGGYKALVIGSPHINVNMEKGKVLKTYAEKETTYASLTAEQKDEAGNQLLDIGNIGNIYGGGYEANIDGDTWVEIGTGTQHNSDGELVAITPARNAANITGSVYGGGNKADITGNTNVTMANGTVGDRIFGGGNLGNVGTISNRTAVEGHLHSGDCLGGKPNFADGTGICTVTVSGGQVGPTGMTMPDDFGYVFGASRGELKDPADDPDIDFRAYVQKTDVTISGTAFITGGVYGGSENGRVRGDTYVTIDGDCQIGSGSDKTTAYASTDFINPATATAGKISEAALAMPGCAHWEFRSPWVPYDAHPYDATADTTGSDGHTFYGNVFGGGSGYFPYLKKGTTSKYEWLESAGQVDGDTHLTISGGHILTNAYGGNELTDVTGTCYVTMTGGTIGVPRTEEQIKAHPVICNLFGAGKGDQRVHFNKRTNVGNTVVAVSGGTIYGSVFGGGEDGHVLKNASLTIGEGAVIGTWGKSGFDGNVFGGGRGFSGEALTAGNVAGSVSMDISGGNVLGSVYGGGRLASVGYGLYAATDTENYGKMREDNTDDDGNTVADFPRGHINITISGGTIGNKYEYDYAEGSRLSHTIGGNVFAGGMGRMYQLDGTTPISSVDWWKLGNVKSTKLTINGGTIKSNVYGGSELGWVQGTHKTADNKDVATEILITGGTIGTEITKAVVETVDDGNGGTTTETKNVPQYTFGSVYGGGRGDTTEKLFTSEVKDKVTDNPKFTAGRVVYSTQIKMEDGAVKGSIYGGGEVGNVGLAYSYGEITDANTDFNKSVSTNVSISGGSVGIDKVGSTYFGGPTMGNVYGGGSGDRSIVRCGLVLGNTNVSISEAEGKKTNIYHNVYGGGAFGSVGDFEYTAHEDEATSTIKVFGIEKLHTEGTGTATVTVTGGTIGTDGNNNGMVFGSSRGDVSAPQQGEGATTLATRDDYMAWVSNTHVKIGTKGEGIDAPLIKGSVYGSGENGHTFNNTTVNIHSGTIGIADKNVEGYELTVDGKTYRGAEFPDRGNVYGGGCGTDTYTVGGEERYNPLAGIVYGNTTVNIDGGFIVHNVYGAGSMGSVGRITNVADTATVAKHADEDNGFALSWPYEFKYQEGTGKAAINITGGHIGTIADGGDVYGAARGEAGDRYATAHLARVHETEVNINFPYSLGEGVDEMTYMTNSANACITGAVHGSGEDGYVYGDTKVTLTNGLIGHSLYGGGKGMGTYKKSLKRLDNGESYDADIYSVIAGKVMGNTEVTVTGGHVVRNVYGGGNMGSVGKGNYAGGADDYSTTGYGETLRGNLWDQVSDDSKAFMNSGKTTVLVTGGTIGYIDATDSTASFKDGLPYGNVFGGSRGMAAPNVPGSATPRYLYTPTFFSGYVNETDVTIGTVGQSSEDADQDVKAPLILGSVYGGGQDGHVRRSTHVTVNSGEIGIPYTGTTTELNEPHWLYRGNVYGAGSGISEFEYDFNGNGNYDDTFVIDGRTYAEKGHSTSAGSVTHFTQVDIKGGTIYRNVVGGGSLASVGPPKITQGNYAAIKGTNAADYGTQSLNLVNIGGLQKSDGKYVKVNIGEAAGVAAGYGGNVFGGGRGDESLGSGFGTSIWTQVNILDGANILGNVFGGGNAGEVLKDTDVQIGRKDE